MPTSTSNFMLLADPQFGIASFLLKKLDGRTTPRKPGESVAPPGTPESGWPYELERLNRAISIANELNPDFVAVLGDMVMHWNNQQQTADVLAAFEKLSPSIPVRWVPGNHDVGVDFLAASEESLAAYRRTFGPDRYSFTSGLCRFVVLNSPLFDKPESVPAETQDQFAWLEREFEKPLPDGVHHTVVLAHHPPIIRDIDEDYGTYNLPQPGRSRLMDLLNRNGVQYLFAGHTHANILTRHEAVRVVATSAVGVSRSGRPGGYRLVRATPDEISHSFHALP